MLLLLFQLQEDAYAIDGAKVVEVIPFLTTQKIPMTPRFITGMANHRGRPVPVIDLGLLLNDTPCRQQLSTRITLTSVSLGRNFQKMVGLLAENVTETVKPPKNWQFKPGDHGPAFIDQEVTGRPMVRWFNPERMLPEDIPGLSFVEQG